VYGTPYAGTGLHGKEDPKVQERYLGRIEPDMDVCDMNGDKIGSISRVYRHEMAAVTAGGAETSGTPLPESTREEIVEVKTGFLGLGRHLYVPMRDIQEVTQGCVFVNKSKDDVDNLEWTTRPDYLDQLT
jgi:hypothetical protein